MWSGVTFAESDSEPGVEHAIERRPDGAHRCACMSFRFARGQVGSSSKSCKHLRAYLGGVIPPQAVAHLAPTVRTVAGETFTFRAMAFGGLRAAR